eukprot:3066577-Rhodomonas_salina.2
MAVYEYQTLRRQFPMSLQLLYEYASFAQGCLNDAMLHKQIRYEVRRVEGEVCSSLSPFHCPLMMWHHRMMSQHQLLVTRKVGTVRCCPQPLVVIAQHHQPLGETPGSGRASSIPCHSAPGVCSAARLCVVNAIVPSLFRGLNPGSCTLSFLKCIAAADRSAGRALVAESRARRDSRHAPVRLGALVVGAQCGCPRRSAHAIGNKGSGITNWDSGFRVQGPGVRTQTSGFKTQGPGFIISGLGSRVWDARHLSMRAQRQSSSLHPSAVCFVTRAIAALGLRLAVDSVVIPSVSTPLFALSRTPASRLGPTRRQCSCDWHFPFLNKAPFLRSRNDRFGLWAGGSEKRSDRKSDGSTALDSSYGLLNVTVFAASSFPRQVNAHNTR